MDTSEPTKESIAEKMGVEGKADAQEPATDKDKAVEPEKEAEEPQEPDYKKMYSDSTREVQENLLPKVKSYDYMMAMVDKHPELAETWNKVLDLETGKSTTDAPVDEPSPDDRIKRLEEQDRVEKIALTNDAIRTFRQEHPDLSDVEYDKIAGNASVHIRKYANSMSFKDAIRQSLDDEYFLQNRDRAKDEGRNELILEQKKAEAALFSQASSAPSGSSKEVLTSGQKAIAEKLGVSLEKAAKYAK